MIVVALLVIFGFTYSSGNQFDNCPLSGNQRNFEVLPGAGWDNLENVEMGRVMHLNFSNCKFSQDGEFLIPNHVSITPLKESTVSLESEIVDHFSNYKSLTSKSINIDASGTYYVTLGGSFSYESSRAKEDQLHTKSSLSIVQLRYTLYSAMFQPDAILNPTFKNRLLDIASLIIEDKDFLYPQYLADMIVRDYGTHVVRSVEAGAILVKTDALNSEYRKKFAGDSSVMTAAASASFHALFSLKISGGSKSSKSDLNEYNTNCAITHVDTFGGTLYGSDFQISEWEQSVKNNFVAVDRRGEPLHYAITPRVLPELDTKIVERLAGLIKDATKRYYTANTRIGCLDVNSKNFDSNANVDGKDCKSSEMSFTFGGIYQTCTGNDCGSVFIKNKITGDYKCPAGFREVQILQGIFKCKETCTGQMIGTLCAVSCTHYKTFWCAPLITTNGVKGYIFGGYYSPSKFNPITNTKACPDGFIPQRLGLESNVCVAPYDTKLGKDQKATIGNFGGFYSCEAGNPLATSKWGEMTEDYSSSSNNFWPKKCPTGYTSHTMIMERGCQFSYCSVTDKIRLSKNPPVYRPPFIQINFNPNVTEVFQFTNSYGHLFKKDTEGLWRSNGNWFMKNKVILISAVSSVMIAVAISLMAFVILRKMVGNKLHQITENIPYEHIVEGVCDRKGATQMLINNC